MDGSGAGGINPACITLIPTRRGREMDCVRGRFFWQFSSAELSGESKLPTNTMTRLKHYLRNYKPYIVASEIKAVLKEHLTEANNHSNDIDKTRETLSRKRLVLLCYGGVHSKSWSDCSDSHTAYWEALQMAKTYLEFGYCVDVISAGDAGGFLPQKQYALFVGHRHNFERVARRLNTDCVKVLHCDVAHWLFHNSANSSRLLALQRRKGITLPQLKVQVPNLAIERADCATILGNEFTISTYRYANKPIYRVPISAPVLYPWPEGKDFEACRRRFLWLGSNGFVHKGLDLVLEAFAAMPEYHLTVCGPIKDEVEKDFEQTFYKELYQTSNIHTVGWVDVDSPEFIQIANGCVALIYPSCSEGGGGSVIACMHAGLIPIVSYESSVDIDTFGVLLRHCSIEKIRDSLRMVASLPAQKLEEWARKAWEFARANHTRKIFADEYSKVAGTILSPYGCDAGSLGSVRQKRLNGITDTRRHLADADLSNN